MATYTYTTISNADVAVGAPIDTALMTSLRDNPLAVGENDQTSSVPLVARQTALLGTVDVSSGSPTQAQFTGLDLSLYRYLICYWDNISTSGSNTGHRINGQATNLWQSGLAANNNDCIVAIDLLYTRAPLFGAQYNGVSYGIPSSVSTPFDTTVDQTDTTVTLALASGTFDAGDISIWGAK